MKNMLSLTKLSIFSLLMLVVLFAAPAATAFDGRTGGQVVVGADEVINDDLYAAGETVMIDGTVRGDLVTAAQRVVINGVIEGDLIAAAQSVVINGSVQDDTRIAGAVLLIGEGASLSDDVLAAGYSLEVQPGTQIEGDLLYTGYRGAMDGVVNGNLFAGSQRLAVNGTVAGNMQVEVDTDGNSTPNWTPTNFAPGTPAIPDVPAGLTLGDDASIAGALTYTTQKTLDLPQAQIGGTIRHVVPSYDLEQKVEVSPANLALNWLMDNFRRLVALIVVGLLLAWLLPAWIRRPAAELSSQPLLSFGWGALAAMALPFIVMFFLAVIIVLALVFGALTLGNLVGVTTWVGGTTLLTLLVSFFLVMAYLTKAIVGYTIGTYLLGRINPQYTEKPYAAVLVGVTVLAIVIAIPIFGGLVSLIVSLLGLGALVLILKNRYFPARPAPVMVAQ